MAGVPLVCEASSPGRFYADLASCSEGIQRPEGGARQSAGSLAVYVPIRIGGNIVVPEQTTSSMVPKSGNRFSEKIMLRQ